MTLQKTLKRLPALNTSSSVKTHPSEDSISRPLKARQLKREVLPNDRFSVLACLASEELKSIGIGVDGWKAWKGHSHNKSKLFSSGSNHKSLKKFSTPLEEWEDTIPYEVVFGDSSFCVRIPDIMAECLEYLENCVTTVGLFRIAGSSSRIKLLQAKLDSGVSLEQLNPRPHDVACLLKTFLSSLPTRLVPEYACNIFWHILNMPEDCFLKSVLLTVFLLPTMHIQCLQALLSFLARVNANEKHNKMSLDSLAIILAPSLFQKQNGKKITQNEIQNGISILETLLHNYEKIGVEKFCFNFQPSYLMSAAACQNDKKNRRRKGSLTDLFRLRRKKENLSISSPFNFETPNSRPILLTSKTISPQVNRPMKGRSVRKRGVAGEEEPCLKKTMREKIFANGGDKSASVLAKKRVLGRRNAFKRTAKEGGFVLEEKPFEFHSGAISLEDVRLNLNFVESQPEESDCYVFTAPLDPTLSSNPSLDSPAIVADSDTSTPDTSGDMLIKSTEELNLPLSPSEESLVRFANSLASIHTSKYDCVTPIECKRRPDHVETGCDLRSASDSQLLSSTPISPEAINRHYKVTFDQKPARIHMGPRPIKPDILSKERPNAPMLSRKSSKSQLSFNFTPSCFQVTPKTLGIPLSQGKDLTFTDSETPATFQRGVTTRKSFKKFPKPFQLKKFDSKQTTERDSSDPDTSPILQKVVRKPWSFKKYPQSPTLLAVSKIEPKYDTTPECKRKCKQDSPDLTRLLTKTASLSINDCVHYTNTYQTTQHHDRGAPKDCLPGVESPGRRYGELPDLIKHTTIRRQKRTPNKHRTPTKPPRIRSSSLSSHQPLSSEPMILQVNTSVDSNSSFDIGMKDSPGILPWKSDVNMVAVSPVEKILKAKSGMRVEEKVIETEKLPSVASSVKLFENMCRWSKGSAEKKSKKILKRNSLKARPDDSKNSPQRYGIRKCLSFKLLGSLNYD